MCVRNQLTRQRELSSNGLKEAGIWLMSPSKCTGRACLFAWLAESDPADLQQAMMRDRVLQRTSSEDMPHSNLIKSSYPTTRKD